MARGKKSDHTPVDSIRHADKRANIPTEELRDFVVDEERSPKCTVYPRDPSLDPQLVWKGKDEQDSKDLEVPAVPIYVQEKIHPQALIENLRETAKAGELESELTLFDDYDGLEFEELIDFYHHEQNWSNRIILGDSLLVMNSLAEKEALRGQVQMVYMDPPYGIKFGSNWQVSTRKPRVTDGAGADVTRQPEQIRAFRDTWEHGVSSYLAYLRDRLVMAHQLLTESGSVFVQIGPDNEHLVRCLLDEVFGSENHVTTIVYQKTTGAGSPSGGTNALAETYDLIVWYGKNKSALKYRQLFKDKEVGGEGASLYTHIEMSDGSRRPLTTKEKRSGELPPEGRAFGVDNLTSSSGVDKTRYPVVIDGRTFRPNPGVWKTSEDGMKRLIAAGRVYVGPGAAKPGYIRYIDDFPASPLANVWTDTVGQNQLGGPKVFVVQTALKAVQRCILMSTDPGDLVLDPTCGSGTTALVAEQWGRRWITIDTSRVAAAISRSRLMAAVFPYYMLADTDEGAMQVALSGGPVPEPSSHSADIRKGFVCRRITHIQLKDIANNPDLSEGMSKDDARSAIARHSGSELMLDQPVDVASRIRVSGPFTVESLSPHRMLDTTEDEQLHRQGSEYSDFAEMIVANLKRSGVQNTRKEERLVFDGVEPFPGEWINAVGQYRDEHGAALRAAISIGPEHGTVGSEQVKEAAKEAVKGVGFDLLIVLGFAFDAHAGETASEMSPDTEFLAAESSKQYGRLRVLLARMNPDLAMGDELLKKTGAGNLFTVFGEPDVELRSSDGHLTVQVNGIDVYDPTTGQVRSSSTDDIACWLVDTNYNGESFFVRHAYFTGADDPYGKLKRALKADINEAAWAALYSTVSRPFDPPTTGKIAVKVINHYGDEVMKVYEV